VKAVNEINVIAPGNCDQPEQLSPFRLRVWIPPTPMVIGIILGRIKVGVHTAVSAKIEEKLAVRHRPWRTEKPLNDTAAFKALRE
jgi:hypothetical protein